MSVLVIEPLFVVADYLAESLHGYAVFVGASRASRPTWWAALERRALRVQREIAQPTRRHVDVAERTLRGGHRMP